MEPSSRVAGTPVGGLIRKKSRLTSPLHEMDDDVGEEELVPSSPIQQPNFGATRRQDAAEPFSMKALTQVIRNEISPLTTSVEQINTKFDILNERLGRLERRIDLTEVRIEKLERFVETPHSPVPDPSIHQKLEELRKYVDSIRNIPLATTSSEKPGDGQNVAVLGGLGAFTQQQATTWLKDKLQFLEGPRILDTYFKGDTFKGLLFAKFANAFDRDLAVSLIRSSLSREDKGIWANEDLPLPVRVRRSFLFGLKRCLADWGFPKQELSFDEAATTMTIGPTSVLNISIEGSTMNYTWHGAWADWQEFHSSSELRELIGKASASLQKLGANGKGQGKSKYAPSRA